MAHKIGYQYQSKSQVGTERVNDKKGSGHCSEISWDHSKKQKQNKTKQNKKPTLCITITTKWKIHHYVIHLTCKICHSTMHSMGCDKSINTFHTYSTLPTFHYMSLTSIQK